MTTTSQARHHLRDKLREALGHDAADTLMEELGSLGREQSSLRQAMDLGFAKVEREMAELRAELKTEMAELRTEFAELRTEFGGLRTTVAERLEQQTRQLLFGMIGSMATISAIAFGAARLG